MRPGEHSKLGLKRISLTEYVGDLCELREWLSYSEMATKLVDAESDPADAELDKDLLRVTWDRPILIVEDEALWEETGYRAKPVHSLPPWIYNKKHPLTALSSATHFRNITSQAPWAFPSKGINLTAYRKPTATPQRI
jgi:hypothetical protein